MSLENIRSIIDKEKNPEQAKILQRFFKTGKGEYGEGDIFYGIKVPVQRKIAVKFNDIALKELKSLISSPVHEERLIASLILVEKFSKGNQKERKIIFNFYLKNRKGINNWDLVDLTAPKIIGEYLFDKSRNILHDFAKSENLWEKRIAIISTFAFIRKDDFTDTLKIAEMLLNDEHDLIHKAVGWMLREIGKRNMQIELNFLKRHHISMPRTMLRYAIEKFPESKRKKILEGRI